MNRGAGGRRIRTRLRVAVLGAVVGVWTLGSGLPAASAAPYPPTAPCALSWAAPSSPDVSSDGRPVLVGSGLGGHRTVDVTLYPQSQSLGSYATDASGAFATPVSLPATSDSSWLTASSGTESCSTRAPRRADRSVPGTRPSSPSSAATSTPRLGVDPTSVAARQPDSVTRVATGRGAAAASSGATDYPPLPYPPTTGSVTGTRTTAPPTGASSSTPGSTPASPSRPSHSTPPQSLSTNTLGVPLSVILGLAVLLVVAGGAAVLILTRRAN